MCFLLARVELPDRQEHIIAGVIIRAVEPGAPALQSIEQALAGGFVTTGLSRWSSKGLFKARDRAA